MREIDELVSAMVDGRSRMMEEGGSGLLTKRDPRPAKERRCKKDTRKQRCKDSTPVRENRGAKIRKFPHFLLFVFAATLKTMIMGESALAASYCRLYRSLPTPHDTPVWEEDTWTEDDEKQAQKLLQSASDKCRIESSNVDDASWERFYRCHTTNFFQDRHYLTSDFEFETPETLVEIGCGVGNAMLPLLEGGWTCYGMDLSSTAIDLLRKDERFLSAGDRTDAVVGNLVETVPPFTGTVVSLLFCLSAIAPGQQRQAMLHAAAAVRLGGVLIFRDYGRYDQAQLQLGQQREKCLEDNFYRKHDGTCCYYFDLDDVRSLVEEAGLEVLELRYMRRRCTNRATNQVRRRVWVHGRFQKPC